MLKTRRIHSRMMRTFFIHFLFRLKELYVIPITWILKMILIIFEYVKLHKTPAQISYKKHLPKQKQNPQFGRRE